MDNQLIELNYTNRNNTIVCIVFTSIVEVMLIVGAILIGRYLENFFGNKMFVNVYLIIFGVAIVIIAVMGKLALEHLSNSKIS